MARDQAMGQKCRRSRISCGLATAPLSYSLPCLRQRHHSYAEKRRSPDPFDRLWHSWLTHFCLFDSRPLCVETQVHFAQCQRVSGILNGDRGAAHDVSPKAYLQKIRSGKPLCSAPVHVGGQEAGSRGIPYHRPPCSAVQWAQAENLSKWMPGGLPPSHIHAAASSCAAVL